MRVLAVTGTGRRSYLGRQTPTQSTVLQSKSISPSVPPLALPWDLPTHQSMDDDLPLTAPQTPSDLRCNTNDTTGTLDDREPRPHRPPQQRRRRLALVSHFMSASGLIMPSVPTPQVLRREPFWPQLAGSMLAVPSAAGAVPTTGSAPHRLCTSTTRGRLPSRLRWPLVCACRCLTLMLRYVAQFEPYRVLCASCDKWIRLRPNSTYSSIPWDAHRKSCKCVILHPFVIILTQRPAVPRSRLTAVPNIQHHHLF